MKVGELIALLLQQDQEEQVFRDDSEYGPEEVMGVEVADKERLSFFGKHNVPVGSVLIS